MQKITALEADPSFSPRLDLEVVQRSLSIAKITYALSIAFFSCSILLNSVVRYYYQLHPTLSILAGLSVPLTAVFFAYAWSELGRNQTIHLAVIDLNPSK